MISAATAKTWPRACWKTYHQLPIPACVPCVVRDLIACSFGDEVPVATSKHTALSPWPKCYTNSDSPLACKPQHQA
eukprot:1344388-Rhodomonas_salina.1